MKTPAALALCLSLLAGLTACDNVEELNIYTEGGSLIYTNTEYLYQNDPRLSIPLNPGNYQMQLMYGFNRCSFQIRAGHTTTVYYAYGSINGEVTYD